MTDNRKRPFIYFPIVVALALMFGIYLGLQLSGASQSPSQSGVLSSFSNRNFNKLNEIINYIEAEYVDSVAREDLVNEAIGNMLSELDPHSYYISPEELAALNEPLQGNFEGIGIEFSVQKDTVVVIAPVAGGPSEELGIQAGDRIVKVEEKTIAGVEITNREIIDLLRGKEGSKVGVSVLRKGVKDLIPYTITRGKIPIFSVDVAYMVDESIGYMKVSRFSKTTYDEFMKHGSRLLNEGMEELILDLRGNGGGFLETAIKMADEFLGDGLNIVYTQGNAHPRKTYDASTRGKFENTKLVVLIDEGSASASEIIAGAIQDNDRGTILGRRSFGKGLVQEQSDWPDGSALRLTIARYYTPSGRCIQRPYEAGNFDSYYDAPEEDSSAVWPDSLKFLTLKGRTVYGGGGIAPDQRVPIDTNGRSFFYTELLYRGLIRQFAFEYSDRERDQLKGYTSPTDFKNRFDKNGKVFESFLSFTEENGVVRDELGLARSGDLIRNRLFANIARYVWNNDGFYPIIHQQDAAMELSRTVLTDSQLSGL